MAEPDRRKTMYKPHRAFNAPADPKAKIWHYMDITKFLSLIMTRQLFFGRLDRTSDPLDGSVAKMNLRQRDQLYKDLPASEIESAVRFRAQLRKHMVIHCWHLNEVESAAMWKLYLKSDEGVAIQSTFTRLCDSFRDVKEHDVHVGSIRYIDFDREFMPEDDVFSPVVHKRKSFAYEQEVRAVIAKLPATQTDDDRQAPPFKTGLAVPVDITRLIEKVYVSPSSQRWVADLIRTLVQKFEANVPVVHSALGDDPVF